MRPRKIQLPANRYLLPEDVTGEELVNFLSVITRCIPLDFNEKEVPPGDWQSEITITDYTPAKEEDADTPSEPN